MGVVWDVRRLWPRSYDKDENRTRHYSEVQTLYFDHLPCVHPATRDPSPMIWHSQDFPGLDRANLPSYRGFSRVEKWEAARRARYRVGTSRRHFRALVDHVRRGIV